MKKITLIWAFVIMSMFVFAQEEGGSTCAEAAPICTDYQYDFPANTDFDDSESGPDYGCLLSQPAPSWYYFEISTSGDIVMDLHGEIDPFWGDYYDIDFIIWGPFTSIECDLSSANIVDCSYSTTGEETPEIGPNSSEGSTTATAGEFYMMMITNYAEEIQDYSLSQSGGGGATDCSIVNPLCSVDAGPDQEICLGETTSILASGEVLNSVGGYTFDWSPVGMPITDSSQNVTVNIPSQIYTVTLTTDDGCIATDDVIISTIDVQITNITTNTSTCGFANGSATITSNIGTYYDIGTESNTTGVFTNLNSGTYSVTVSNNGCDDTQDFTIGGTQPITNITYISSDVICNGDCDGSAIATPIGGVAPYSYVWSNGYLSDSPSNLCAGLNALTITDSNGCVFSNDILINEPLPLNIGVINITDVSCFGLSDASFEIETTNGTLPYTFNMGTISQPENIFNNLSADIYDVLVVDGNNCQDAISITITEPNDLILSETNTDVSCFGYDDGHFELTAIGGTLPYTYTDYDEINLCPGDYTISVIDNNGCVDDVTINITQPSEISSSISDFNICFGSSIDLIPATTGGVSPYNYVWNTSETTNSINVSPFDTTIYSYDIVDINGCIGGPYYTQVNPTIPMILELFPKDTIVCPGQYTEISYTIDHGIGPYTALLNDDIISENPVTIYPILGSNFEITIIDGCGSTISKNINMTNYLTPVISFQSDVLSGCEPLEINLTCFNDLDYADYYWDFGDNHISFDKNSTHIYNQQGLYHVGLKITTKDECVVEKIINNMITVFPLPYAIYRSTPNVVDDFEPGIYFDNLSEGHQFSYWSFGDNDSSNIENPYHEYKQTGIYDVSLMVETNFGCTDTVITRIYVNDVYTLWIPNSFSPDGDGINETFHIKGHNVSDENYIFEVYDRWGEIIYTSNNINDSWDGKYKDDYVKSGVYVYYLIFMDDVNKVRHERSGTITIIN